MPPEVPPENIESNSEPGASDIGGGPVGDGGYSQLIPLLEAGRTVPIALTPRMVALPMSS